MRRADCVFFLQWSLPRLGLRWPGFRKVRSQVCKRLNRRVRDLGLADLAAYREYLEEHPLEWSRVGEMCRITISRFCRDRGVFDALVDEVLPVLADQARRARVVRSLSCGCASGEEPYTLAIAWRCVLAERYQGVDLAVTAVDIDSHMLERAHAGTYPPMTVRELPPAWRRSAFEADGDALRVREPFRTGMIWSSQDVRTAMLDGPFDLVLCRNLAFTYFDHAGQLQMLRRLAGWTRPGGFLVIGKHERLPDVDSGFQAWRDHLRIYRREDVPSDR